MAISEQEKQKMRRVKSNEPEDYLPLPKRLKKLEEISDEYWWICKVGYRMARPASLLSGPAEPEDARIVVVSGDGLLLWKCIVHDLRGLGEFEILRINEHGAGKWTRRFNTAMGCPVSPSILRQSDIIGQKVNIRVLEKVLLAGRLTPIRTKEKTGISPESVI
jgi:hypothetical protein